MTAPGPGWRDRAACAGRLDLFDEPDAEGPRQRQWREDAARRVCATCPVQPACLRFALATNQAGGIWGGLDGRQRRAERRRLGLAGLACPHPDSELYADAEGHRRCRACKRASDRQREQRRRQAS